MGVDHTLAITASCKDCLKKKGIPAKFAKEHPEEAKAIKNWVES